MFDFGRKQFIAIFIILLSVSRVYAGAAGIVPASPQLDASSWLLMDYDSGQILVEQNVDRKLPPASLTKMMTVYVAAGEIERGHISLADEVVVSEKAWRMPGSRMFIEVNDRVTVEELLKGIIIQSGNDASVALAEYIAGSEDVFANLMNKEARRLGLTNTHYVNSTGLPHEEHYTTARDLAILARAMIRDYPAEYEWHAIREYTYNDIKQSNRNNLLWRDGSVDGIKTGHTEEAGYCLVASAKRDSMRLISVVLGTSGSEARIKASQSLLNYGFRFFETHRLYAANEPVTTTRVWKGDKQNLDLGLGRDLFITVPRGQYDKLNAEVVKNGRIIAPVMKGEQQGMLQISLAGKELLQTPVLALEDVHKGPLLQRLKDEVRLFFE